MKENIKNYILQKAGKDIILEEQDNIFDKALLNSMFALQLITYLEKEYKISIENDDLKLENFDTVEHITNFVQQKLAN